MTKPWTWERVKRGVVGGGQHAQIQASWSAQEGGILGDEFAELDESLHGSGGEEEREREEGMASVLLLFLVHFACPEVRTCSTRMHGQGN